MHKRGFCPSLQTPLVSGDGILVRIRPGRQGISPALLGDFCSAAYPQLSGPVEVTSRGALQFRGLDQGSFRELESRVRRSSLQTSTAPTIETSPLIGLDPYEVTATDTLVQRLEVILAERDLDGQLSPKFSMIVDGSGYDLLSERKADLRLRAVQSASRRCWQLAYDDDWGGVGLIGFYDDDDVVEEVILLVEQMAKLGKDARARDLFSKASFSGLRGNEGPAFPFGAILPFLRGKMALRLALPFGSADVADMFALLDLCESEAIEEIRIGGEGSLFLIGEKESNLRRLREQAVAHGFIISTTDPRAGMSACSGKPFCSSGRYQTRTLANAIATSLTVRSTTYPWVSFYGCGKRCGLRKPGIEIIGDDHGVLISGADGEAMNGVIQEIHRFDNSLSVRRVTTS